MFTNLYRCPKHTEGLIDFAMNSNAHVTPYMHDTAYNNSYCNTTHRPRRALDNP